jgi:hypothetical protein
MRALDKRDDPIIASPAIELTRTPRPHRFSVALRIRAQRS